MNTVSEKVNNIEDRLSAVEEGGNNGLNLSRGTNISQASGGTYTVPGNSSYASLTSRGRKVVLLSDSMCGRMKMKKLNNGLVNKTLYRKHYPGATPDDILHYCTRTLDQDQPDIAVLHVGTNKVMYEDPFETAAGIMKIVETCKEYGCNQIFVSGIIYRPDAEEKVNQLNDILYQWSFLHGYTFIFNSNIKEDCLDSGKLHLTYRGSARLASNFRRALNKPHV